MPFTFKRLNIPEVILVEAKAFSDERGFFMESFKQSLFYENGIITRFVQDNYSHSIRGVLRGLHYQKEPKAQAKLVMVMQGEIFDVAVDMRKGSPTYSKWIGETLSAKNHRLIYVPEGFAHGFQALEDNSEVFYQMSEFYSPEHQRGLRYNDPAFGLNWPINATVISDRDGSYEDFRE